MMILNIYVFRIKGINLFLLLLLLYKDQINVNKSEITQAFI